MFSSHRLRLLVELHRRGTIAKVAEALAYSPSTISQQLAQLEREAGSTLLEPVGRKVRLTNAGEILVRHAEQILTQLDRAHAELAEARSEVAGHVRLATFQTAAISFIPALLATLSERHPAVALHLSEIQPDAGTAALLARDFDLVLGEEYPGISTPANALIDRRPLLEDTMRLYVPRRPSGKSVRRKGKLSDYADRPWVMEPRDKPARAWAELVCRSQGFEPDVRFESADLLVHAELVETGHAVALLPDLMWRSRKPRGIMVDLPTPSPREIYTAVRRGSETRPVLVALRQILDEVIATSPSSVTK